MTHSAQSSSDAVGIVGLGLLGSALAERLVGAGFEIVGHDIDAARRKEAARLGVEVAGDARGVVSRCARLLLCLPNTGAVAKLLEEISPALHGDQTIIDVTTGHPDATVATAERLAKLGVAYIDATVAGSSAQARKGEVLVLMGGAADAVERVRDIIASFAGRVFHLGESGAGARMKLVVNLVLGLNRAVLAEGLAFAERTGIDPRRALEVLEESVAYSRVMDIKGEKMLEGEFSPQARLAQHLKDVRLILETGSSSGARLPLSTLHEEILATLDAAGFGAEDNSAVLRFFGLGERVPRV